MSGSEYGGRVFARRSPGRVRWNGEIGRRHAARWQGNWDIYIKLVGSSELRRLTTDPGIDLAPRMVAGRSPDRVRAAWTALTGSPQIRVVSSLGGADRQVSDFPVLLPAVWSPDGRYLVAGRAGAPDPAGPTQRHLSDSRSDGGEPRAITRPRAPGQDLSAAFSAGRPSPRVRLVSRSGSGLGLSLQVVNLDAAFAAVGAPRRLTGPARDPGSEAV